MRNHGLTLVELLTSLALLGVIVSIVLAIHLSVTRLAAELNIRNELLSETQVAQHYVASKLKQAVYVFPVGTVLQLGNSGYSTRKPGTTSSVWTVGIDPIIAFILPPRSHIPGLCTSNQQRARPSHAEFCYTFYAYYPVERDVMSSYATGANDPGTRLPHESNSWVLMEYRRHYSSVSKLGQELAQGISGGTGLMVLDDVRPPSRDEHLFTQSLEKIPAPGVTHLGIYLATQHHMNKKIKIPSDGRYRLVIYPRNLNNIIIPN